MGGCGVWGRDGWVGEVDFVHSMDFKDSTPWQALLAQLDEASELTTGDVAVHEWTTRMEHQCSPAPGIHRIHTETSLADSPTRPCNWISDAVHCL